MAHHHPDAPKQIGSSFLEETIKKNKELIVKIDSKSILLAPEVKGSLYFYTDAMGSENLSKEELIDDPSALDSASNDLRIKIRHENKHHRWVAQIPQALKILEFAAAHLKQNSKSSANISGINAELKWRDEQDQENIIHLSQCKDNAEWQVARYT